MTTEPTARMKAMHAALVELAQEMTDPDLTVPNLVERIRSAVRRAVPDADEREIWEAVLTYKEDHRAAERGPAAS